MKNKCHFFLSVLVSFAVSFFFVVAVPLQTFMSNRDMFNFALVRLCAQLLPYFLACFITLFVILILLGRIFGRFPHLFFLLIGICGFLEVGVLSLGLPPLNGAMAIVNRPSFRKVMDFAVFAVLLGVGTFAFYWVRNYIQYISYGFLIMTIASIFDANKNLLTVKGKTDFDEGFCQERIDVWKSAEFSPRRNILIFVIDAAPGDIALDVLGEHPEIKDFFRGFVAYRNNIGMHERTLRGVPALVSGKYLEKETKTDEWLSLFYDNRGGGRFLKRYLNARYDLYIAPQCASPYTNNRKSWSDWSSKRITKNKLLQYTENRPFVNLLDVIVYRLLPWRNKGRWIEQRMMIGDQRCGVAQLSDREDVVYGILRNASTVSTNMTFHYYHTGGVHTPIYRDGSGALLDRETQQIGPYKEYYAFVLKQLGLMMDYLQEKGVYDQSMIVVTTDHGAFARNIADLPKSALLWVKPIGVNHGFDISDLPTSHSKIGALLSASVDCDLERYEIDKILFTKDRLLRVVCPTPEKWWYFGKELDTFDIIFDENGNEISRENLGRFATW